MDGQGTLVAKSAASDSITPSASLTLDEGSKDQPSAERWYRAPPVSQHFQQQAVARNLLKRQRQLHGLEADPPPGPTLAHAWMIHGNGPANESSQLYRTTHFGNQCRAGSISGSKTLTVFH